MILHVEPIDPDEPTLRTLLGLRYNGLANSIIPIPDDRTIHLIATCQNGRLTGASVTFDLWVHSVYPTFREGDIGPCMELYGRITEVVTGDHMLHETIDSTPFLAGTLSEDPDLASAFGTFATHEAAQREFMGLVHETHVATS